jgi:large subunit ribosomal protein L24
MKKTFSKKWNSSVKPNKQRKFRFKAPLHIKGNFLNAHLSKELRAKYNTRSVRVRLGDRVKVMRGQFKKQEGKVEEVNVKKSILFLSKIEHVKRDGTKARYPIQPSNVLIVELNTEDKKRFKDKTQKRPQKTVGVALEKKSETKTVKKASKPKVQKNTAKSVDSVEKK